MSERSLMDQNGDDPSSSNIQVIISSQVSDHISTPTIPAGEEEMSSLKHELYMRAVFDEWRGAKSIYDRYPEMVRVPLTEKGDTALHVAVGRGRETFVRELVNYEHVTRQDLAIPNANGNTAFCLAAITGKRKLLDIMIQKNEDLPLIHGQHGMLPLHLALLSGFDEIVQHLSSESLLDKMALKDIERLLFMAINSNIYDLAKRLVWKYRKPLSIARDDEDNLTALHMLARKPPKENNFQEKDLQARMLYVLWEQVTDLEYNKRLKLITEPSVVIFDALRSGNFSVVESLCNNNDQASDLMMMIKDPENGQNLLHIAVLFRHNRAIDFILNRVWNANLIIRAVDKDRNNVLHFAARQLEDASLSLRPDIQMRRELEWFKEMEKRFPSELRTMRNKYGMTASDAFYANHRKLSNEVKDTAKAVANSGMVVAALVVTVAFAAALTTPGGDKNYNVWFAVFIMANAIALLTSSLSILAFLSIFTSSRFNESDFTTSLYPNLIIGKILLFISVVTMIIAFAAASFLIFGDTYKQVAYVVASFSLLTIVMFLGLQLSLFDGLVNYFGSR